MPEIPIGEPIRKPRQCEQCGDLTGCVYVKTKAAGFRRVCVPCAHRMSDQETLKMPDQVLPMLRKGVF